MEKRGGRAFGTMPDGKTAEEITLKNGAMTCSVITYGGAVRTLTVPDRDGKGVDIALGFDTLEDYQRQKCFMGALVGRYANRIGGARFSLDGKTYSLPVNDGANHLHGGPGGFDKKLWRVEELSDNSVTLSLRSPDGEEGYPGELAATVAYTLADGALAIDYSAVSDRDTVCNLTNHTYFNLAGHDAGAADRQFIRLFASRYTPAAEGLIPTGALDAVDGTPMDLRTPQPIGEHIDDPFAQLAIAGGYDHNWAIDGWDGSLRLAARLWSPDTGIVMETLTTLPGVQFYSGNGMDGCPAGKGGAPYGRRWGVCLETQYFPDTPNQPAFPSATLRAGERYRSRTVYRFGVADKL